MKGNKGGRAPFYLLSRRVQLLFQHKCSKVTGWRHCVLSVLTIGLLVFAKPSRRWQQLRKAVIQSIPIHIGPCQQQYGYDSNDERDFRPYRFPTVEERIQIYMGQFYLPPAATNSACEGRIRYKAINRDQLFLVEELPWQNRTTMDRGVNDAPPLQRIFAIDQKILPARMFFVHARTLLKCADAGSKQEDKMMFYCTDAKETLLAQLPDNITATTPHPILAQFGDASESKAPSALATETLLNKPMLPHFKKFRRAFSHDEVEQFALSTTCLGTIPELFRKNAGLTQSLQPIVWKLNIKRHYKKVGDVACNDVPWSEKKSMAVFRGRLTGFINKDKQMRVGMEDYGTCLAIPRCLLVYRSRSSKTVDAKLTDVAGRIGGSVNGYNMTSGALSMKQMLQYKAIVIVEGNDVSSGLKWALFFQKHCNDASAALHILGHGRTIGTMDPLRSNQRRFEQCRGSLCVDPAT